MPIDILVRDSFDGVSFPTSINGRTWDNVGGGTLAGITHTGLSSEIQGEFSVASRVDNVIAHNSIISNSFNYSNAGVPNSGDGIGVRANVELTGGSSWFRLHPRWVDASNRIIVEFFVGAKPKVTATAGGVQVHNAFMTSFSNVGNSNTLYEVYVVDTPAGVTVTVVMGAETQSVDIGSTGLKVGNIGTAANTLAQWNSGRLGQTWVYDLAIIQFAAAIPPTSGPSLGLTMMGGATEVALTSAGYKLGLMSARFMIVTPDADAAPFTLPPTTGNTEGPDRFIFYNNGARAFEVDTLLRVEIGELVFVGADDTGNWVESGRKRGDDMARISKTVTLAELQALGGVASGEIVIGTLPVGARPVSFTGRRIGGSLASSGGTPNDFQISLRVSGTTTPITVPFTNQHGALEPQGQKPIDIANALPAEYPLSSLTPVTYAATVLVSGAGVLMNNLTAPVGDLFAVEIIYAT